MQNLDGRAEGWRSMLSYRSVQRLLVPVLVLHNAEEGLTARTYLPRVQEHLQQVPALRGWARPPTLDQLYLALALVTVVPALIVVWATTGRESAAKRATVATLVAALLWNVVLPHVPAAILFGGYAPGLLTAVTINFPFALYFFRRSARDGMLGRRQRRMALVAGLLLLVVVPPLLLLRAP
jgi:Protein of unknown function with HXXEE motif